jgi:uncharacterized membrane protein
VNHSRRRTMLFVAAATLFGAMIRFAGIGKLSVWYDEGYTAWAIDHPIRQIIRIISHDTAPPLYYLLLHAWSLLFGRSEAALRGLSALLGILSIPLVAAIADRLAKGSAAAAAWIFALSWWQFAYSQEARGYELISFLTAAMFYCTLRHLDQPNGAWLAAAIAAAAAGLYANNFMLLYITAIGLILLIAPGPLPLRTRLRDLAIAVAVLTAVYLPWIGALRWQIHRVNGDFWIPPPTLDSVCQELSRMCGVDHFWTWDQFIHFAFSNTGRDVPGLTAALLIAGVILSAALLSGDRRWPWRTAFFADPSFSPPASSPLPSRAASSSPPRGHGAKSGRPDRWSCWH